MRLLPKGFSAAGRRTCASVRARRLATAALLALVLAHVAPMPGYARQPYQPEYGDPLLEPWRWQSFPNLNGLALQCIAEGPGGTMWFGTNEGLWSFDGFEWRFLDVDDGIYGSVGTIAGNGEATLYAGGYWGVSQLKDGQWKGLFPGNRQRFGEVRKLFVAQDHSLWIATAWGALHLHDSRWTLHTNPETAAELAARQQFPQVSVELLPESVLGEPGEGDAGERRTDLVEVCEDAQGRLWFGTERGEIPVHTPGAGSSAWTLHNESDGMVTGRWPVIAALKNGAIWVVFRAHSGHANIFDGTKWSNTRLADFGVPQDIGAVIQTRDETVWLSGRYAVAAYRDGRWRTYSRPEAPIPTAMNFMLQSADGALWIAGPSTEVQRVDYDTGRWLTLEALNFQAESPEGEEWFLHRDGRIVLQSGGQWTSFGVEDGLIDTPVRIVLARNGDVWTAGSHENIAATARYRGGEWTRYIHDELSWGVEWRGVMESADGSLWFAATVDTRGPKPHRAGILQFREGTWIHHHQPGRAPSTGSDDDPMLLLPATQRPEPVGKFLCLGESRDGRIWAGRNILVYQDGRQWHTFVPPEGTRLGVIETMYTSRDRELWLGTRQFGAFRYDGAQWQQHQGKDSLVANSVRSFAQTSDGSIWAATDRNVSRFDGRTWTHDVLPASLQVPHEAGMLREAAAGAVWVNRFAPEWVRRAWTKTPLPDTRQTEFWTIRHGYESPPPQTSITTTVREVSPAGSFSVGWNGAVPWRESSEQRLQFSHRLDGEAWSPFTAELGRAFFELPSGKHRLEVRARDSSFNIDPTPAVLEFVVLPPVWGQPWFIALMAVAVALIATQTLRVFRERDRLQKLNRSLASEIDQRVRVQSELERLNLELEQRVKSRTAQLEAANEELETFSFSVSHDLRAPLRSIDGFSEALLDDYAEQLDANGKDCLNRVRAAAQRMDHLIDDMLKLARVTRDEMHPSHVDLSKLARDLADELARADPQRTVVFSIAPEATVTGDARFLRIALENLLGNAWKFTSRREHAEIEFGVEEKEGERIFYVRDNGAGFDMANASRLFEPFRRFHDSKDYPGTGVGLATVHRIIRRHGGRIWAEGRVDHGAILYFVIPGAPVEDNSLQELSPSQGAAS